MGGRCGGTVERCLACEADAVGDLGRARLPNGCDTRPAPRNDLDALRRIRPGNSPSRGPRTWHRLNREHAIDPRLGESRGVATRSKPSEQVISGKIVRPFGSLAPPRVPTDRPRPAAVGRCAHYYGGSWLIKLATLSTFSGVTKLGPVRIRSFWGKAPCFA